MQCGSRLEQPLRLPSSVRLTAQRPPVNPKRAASDPSCSIAAGATRYSVTLRRVDRR
jgi:hypothetical protein